MRYYIIAGEASGDLHGSNLMKSLKEVDSAAEFRIWGGDLMVSAGGDLVRHYNETAVMGVVEVLRKINKISDNIKLCKSDLVAYNPDVLILIDYAGFNLRIAKFAKKSGIKVFYYIAPKVWAWNESRVKKIRDSVDRLFIIFPFEVDFFKKHGINAIYNGNPLLDSIASHPSLSETREDFLKRNNLEDKPIIALLAGSRKNEISYLLPKLPYLENKFPDHQLILAGAPSIERSYYEPFISKSRIILLEGETYAILKHARAAVVSSGTASLETALIGTPQVVCYGMNAITAFLARIVIKVKYASLVNLILDAPVVKELLQGDCTSKNIAAEVKKILSGRARNTMLVNYRKLRKILGEEGASEKVAKAMVKEIEKLNVSPKYFLYHETKLGLLKITCDNSALLEIQYVEDNNNYKKQAGTNTGKKEVHPILAETARQMDEYFAEKRNSFDLPVRLTGTDFQNRVWEELRKIPYGEVKTYGEIAGLVDSKDANRAVGLACKMNPLLIVVPCHRVLGANNKLTGFNIGIDKKSYLLELEKVYQNTENNLFK